MLGNHFVLQHFLKMQYLLLSQDLFLLLHQFLHQYHLH